MDSPESCITGSRRSSASSDSPELAVALVGHNVQRTVGSLTDIADALPSIDEFLPGHNLESLEELSRALTD